VIGTVECAPAIRLAGDRWHRPSTAPQHIFASQSDEEVLTVAMGRS
jgi:hypothetical protein